MRHQLSNLVMTAIGNEHEAHNPETKARYFSARMIGMGFLSIADVLGSLLVEVRQFRNWSLRRPPKKQPAAPSTPGAG